MYLRQISLSLSRLNSVLVAPSAQNLSQTNSSNVYPSEISTFTSTCNRTHPKSQGFFFIPLKIALASVVFKLTDTAFIILKYTKHSSPNNRFLHSRTTIKRTNGKRYSSTAVTTKHLSLTTVKRIFPRSSGVRLFDLFPFPRQGEGKDPR